MIRNKVNINIRRAAQLSGSMLRTDRKIDLVTEKKMRIIMIGSTDQRKIKEYKQQQNTE